MDKEKTTERREFLAALGSAAAVSSASQVFAQTSGGSPQKAKVAVYVLLEAKPGKEEAAAEFDLVMLEHRQQFARHAQALMRERVSDLTDVHIRVLTLLLGLPDHDPVDVPKGANAILVTHDLTPSLTVQLDRGRMKVREKAKDGAVPPKVQDAVVGRDHQHGIATNGEGVELHLQERVESPAREASEEKERDGNDANFVVLGHDAVAEFVEENRSEEEEAGQDADGPMLRVSPKRMLLLELRGDDVGNGRKNKDPSRMEVDGDSQNSSDAQT